jgi:hypothetical protein
VVPAFTTPRLTPRSTRASKPPPPYPRAKSPQPRSFSILSFASMDYIVRMPRTDSPPSFHARPKIVDVTWLLAVVLAAYLGENLWVDGWIRSRFAGLPALLPEPLTTFWFAVFALGGICCVVLLVCAVLVLRHTRISSRVKIFTGIAVVVACALWGVWFNATSANSAVAAAQNKKHSVTLNWIPSSSLVAGYNVYRSDISGRGYVKLNTAPVRGLAYADDTVQGGKTYYYVTRAVDGKGRESGNSAEVVAAVP